MIAAFVFWGHGMLRLMMGNRLIACSVSYRPYHMVGRSIILSASW